jgi:hypothetical protein
MLLVCTDAGRALACQDLNGDGEAPIGAGVYGAEPGRGWRRVRTPRSVGGVPPGFHYSPAEFQALMDLSRVFAAGRSSGPRSGRARPVKVVHLPARRR